MLEVYVNKEENDSAWSFCVSGINPVKFMVVLLKTLLLPPLNRIRSQHGQTV